MTGQTQDLLGRAIVVDQPDPFQVRPQVAQPLLHVAHRAAKTVDGLIGVADGEKAPAPFAGQGRDQAELKGGKVLHLVDQDVVVAGDALSKLEMFEPEFEQVRVVDHIEAHLVVEVAPAVFARDAHPVLAGQGLHIPGQAEFLALQVRIGRREKPAAALLAEQHGGLAHDRSPVFKAQGVQGVGPWRRGQAGAQALQAVFELPGGLAGKGQDQHAGRIGALFDQVAHPPEKGLGLARARPGQDQNRPRPGQDRGHLQFIGRQGPAFRRRRGPPGLSPALPPGLGRGGHGGHGQHAAMPHFQQFLGSEHGNAAVLAVISRAPVHEA